MLVSGGRIAAVGSWRHLKAHFKGPAYDLGDVVVAPGFINAHAHLEYTHLAGRVPRTSHFTDWIGAILSAKSNTTDAQYLAAWKSGAEQLVRDGTTAVVDIASATSIIGEARRSTPLRVGTCIELTGVLGEIPPEKLIADAIALLEPLVTPAPDGNGNPTLNTSGLSPHALYSTMSRLMSGAARVAAARRCLFTTHLAESRDEYEMYVNRRGPLYHWLRTLRSMADCVGGSPVQMAERLGLFDTRFLAVHANYLAPGDAARLGRHGVTVVHCPRSHAFFKHSYFPKRDLDDHNVQICLGTDSLASIEGTEGRLPQLSMRAEMRALLEADIDVTPMEAIEMATIRPARALGWSRLAGEICEGAWADLVVIPSTGPLWSAPAAIAWEELPTVATMIGGAWVWRRSA